MTQGNTSAYPLVDSGILIDGGLTKRELFAAMAMQSFLSNPDPQTMATRTLTICEWSVNAADMLIEALAKEPT